MGYNFQLVSDIMSFNPERRRSMDADIEELKKDATGTRQDVTKILVTLARMETSFDGYQKLTDALHSALVKSHAESEQRHTDSRILQHGINKDLGDRLRKIEDWSLVTKVAAFLGAGGTLGGIAKVLGLMG